jgi:hypothetical protein
MESVSKKVPKRNENTLDPSRMQMEVKKPERERRKEEKRTEGGHYHDLYGRWDGTLVD